jgi:hypothetical protein
MLLIPLLFVLILLPLANEKFITKSNNQRYNTTTNKQTNIPTPPPKKMTSPFHLFIILFIFITLFNNNNNNVVAVKTHKPTFNPTIKPTTAKPTNQPTTKPTTQSGLAACCRAAMHSDTNSALICSNAYKCRHERNRNKCTKWWQFEPKQPENECCKMENRVTGDQLRNFLQGTMTRSGEDSKSCKDYMNHQWKPYMGGVNDEARSLCYQLVRNQCFGQR